MTFTEDQINQFRQLYFKRFGKEIGREEAIEQASKLLRLVMLIYKPMSLKDFDAIQEKRLASLPEIIANISSTSEADAL